MAKQLSPLNSHAQQFAALKVQNHHSTSSQHYVSKISQPSLHMHSDDQDSDDSRHQQLHHLKTQQLESNRISPKKNKILSVNSSKSEDISENDGHYIPLPPLDLFDGKAQNEPNLHAGFRRPTMFLRKDFIGCETDLQCQHENQNQIVDWFCKDCNQFLPQFDCIFDDNQGRVFQYLKICYENHFLEDFLHAQVDIASPRNNAVSLVTPGAGEQQKHNQFLKEQRVPDVIYQQYQPSSATELKEYMLYCISKDQQNHLAQAREKANGQPQEPKVNPNPDNQNMPDEPTAAQDLADQDVFGTGRIKNLSPKLIKYLSDFEETQERLQRHYNGDVLLIDSIFESGNLLQADRIDKTDYNMYMQVDSNSKGHQQWFHFRVQNTRKRKYLFHIMNFTKPGVTVGSGYRKNELKQRILYKSNLSGSQEWKTIGPSQLQFVKTSVARRKKDVLAAGADSDQDEEVEEFFGCETQKAQGDNEHGDFSRAVSNAGVNAAAQTALKKKKIFYYYALVFEVEFEYDDDTVFFAFSQPYTYTQIIRDVLQLETQIQPQDKSQIKRINPKPQQPPPISQPEPSVPVGIKQTETLRRQATFIVQQSPQLEVQPPPPPPSKPQFSGIQFENKQQLLYYRREELCRSVCGLPLWMITIGRDQTKLKKKPVIVITSRVHSGETPASLVFKGMVEFLLSDRKEAKLLRLYYTFILIPCLNPDGVVCGNYRNSASGVDLNRQWINPDEQFHPEIYYTKNLLKKLTEIERRQIWIYCDLHGHSKKKNSFFYGCNTAANGGFLSWTIVRLLPRIFAQKTHMFSFKDCRFKVEPYKVGTGRVVAWKQFSITHSFTLENSFYGYDFGDDDCREFSEEDYYCVGTKFCDSVFEFHYVWKQIQRELNLTNGWLKPRVLNAKTGVPAAQILQEELAKKKREEERQLGIEQYQLFLKKFYNGGKIKNIKFKANFPLGGGFVDDDTVQDYLPIPWNKQQISASQTISIKNLGESQQQVSNTSGIQIEKCLSGLVKLQARIRGWMQRMKLKPQLDALREKRLQIARQKLKKNEGNDLNNSDRFTLQPLQNNGPRQNGFSLFNSNTDSRINMDPVGQAQSQDSTTSQGGAVSKLSTRRFELVSRDWRTYFKEDELDVAFQAVEIEKRDIPEENSSDAGSNSDPSDDNLDPDEIYEKVYQLPKAQTFKLIKERQVQTSALQTQIQTQSPISASQLYNRLKGGPSDNQLPGGGANLRRTSSRPNEIGNQINQLNTQLLSQEKLRLYRQNMLNAQQMNQMNQRQSPYQSKQDRLQYMGSQPLSQSEFLHQNQNTKFSVRAQSSHNQIDNFISVEYNASQRNYAIVKQSRALQSVLRSSQLQQKRPNTSTTVDMYVGIPPQQSILAGGLRSHSKSKDNYQGQFKLTHFNQNTGIKLGKRENITQVIKDCFITRQCGVQRPASKMIHRQKLPYASGLNQQMDSNQNQSQYGFNLNEMQNIGHAKLIQQLPKSSTQINTGLHSYKMDRPRTNKIQASFAIQTVRPQQYPEFKSTITPDKPKGVKQMYQIVSADQSTRAKTTAGLHQSSGKQQNPQQQIRIPQQNNGIRVVKQPNSNMTYLQSYPASTTAQPYKPEYS